MFRPVTFLMLYFLLMRSASSLSARTRSRKSSICLINSGCDWRKASLLFSSPVSTTVPSVSTSRALTIMRSLLACTPQFMPEALLQTIPPTIALPMEAGSGGNTRPKGFSISFTRAPTMPGCRRMVSCPAPISYFSQCLPATMSTDSLMLCPESDVPAARKVKGSPYLLHAWMMRATCCSLSLRTTTLGMAR